MTINSALTHAEAERLAARIAELEHERKHLLAVIEILKEAYAKVGRKADSLKTSRRLAEAYFNSGSYTMAMQECEAILVKEPNAPEILAMLGDIETRLRKRYLDIFKRLTGRTLE